MIDTMYRCTEMYYENNLKSITKHTLLCIIISESGFRFGN